MLKERWSNFKHLD